MTLLNKCLCCNNDDLYIVLDLGDQPLANSYLKNKEEKEILYPLAVNYCEVCGHLQLTHSVDPDELFKNYLYVSGTTRTLRDYFDYLACKIVPQFSKVESQDLKILDIACNDGSQLDSFKKLGCKTFGIDPAENLHHLSSEKHNTICSYFNEESVGKFETTFDVIIAQNVLAHINYPKEFLTVAKRYLSPGGRIFIQTSQATMVSNNEFDTVYHEHISFFCESSFKYLAREAGLVVENISIESIHGNSFLITLLDPSYTKELTRPFNKLELDRAISWGKSALKIKENLTTKLEELRAQGYTLVGYGAAAKGNTLLNFIQQELDFIVDDNPLKVGLYTPGMKIPIKDPGTLAHAPEKTVVIPLAWNFFNEIKSKVANINPNLNTFLKYFPEVSLQIL